MYLYKTENTKSTTYSVVLFTLKGLLLISSDGLNKKILVHSCQFILEIFGYRSKIFRPLSAHSVLVFFGFVLTLPVLDNVNSLLGGHKNRTLQLSESDTLHTSNKVHFSMTPLSNLSVSHRRCSTKKSISLHSWKWPGLILHHGTKKQNKKKTAHLVQHLMLFYFLFSKAFTTLSSSFKTHMSSELALLFFFFLPCV